MKVYFFHKISTMATMTMTMMIQINYKSKIIKNRLQRDGMQQGMYLFNS